MDRQTENFFKAVDGCTVLIICPWIWSSFQTPLFKYSIDRKISFTYSLNPGFCLEPKAVSPVSFQQGDPRSKRDRRLPVFNMMVAWSTNRCMHDWSDMSFICCVTFTARVACATSRKHHVVNEVQRDAVCEAAQSHLCFFLYSALKPSGGVLMTSQRALWGTKLARGVVCRSSRSFSYKHWDIWTNAGQFPLCSLSRADGLIRFWSHQLHMFAFQCGKTNISESIRTSQQVQEAKITTHW